MSTYYELLNPNRIINGDLYCQQLESVQQELQIKGPSLVNRKGGLYLNDSGRPHVTIIMQKIILELQWELVPHPPYSLDLTPTDFHFFRSLQNSLDGKNLNNFEATKSTITYFFNDKSEDFY